MFTVYRMVLAGVAILSAAGVTTFGPTTLFAWLDPTGSWAKTEPVRPPAKSPYIVGFGYVDIEGGTTPLALPLVGRVNEIFVEEGQRVKKSSPLISLESREARARLAQASSAVAEARTRVATAKRAPSNHELQKAQQQQAIDAVKAKLAAKRREVDTLENLAKNAAVASETVLTAKDLLRALEAEEKAEQLKFEQLQLEKPSEAIALAEAALENASAQEQLAREHLANHTLNAPDDGLVLRVLATRGEVFGATPSGPLLWFVAEKPRVVRCEIDQEYAHRVRKDMIAELIDDHSQEPIARGVVARTAAWIAPRRSLLDEPFQRNDVRTLEVVVRFTETPPDNLRIGQRLRVVLRDEVNGL